MTITTAQSDITDVWLENTDPENEFGESVEAFFSQDDLGYFRLEKLEIEDGHGKKEVSRIDAILCLGADVIDHIEKAQAQEAGYDI